MKTPLVYLDTCVYLKVVKRDREEWVDACHAVLNAADRGDIQLAASTVLLMELNSWRGDVDVPKRDSLSVQYLTRPDLNVKFTELDMYNIEQAKHFSIEFHLRGADAAHLASAVRLKCDYFFTFDKTDFPIGSVVKGVTVCQPQPVWEVALDESGIEYPPS